MTWVTGVNIVLAAAIILLAAALAEKSLEKYKIFLRVLFVATVIGQLVLQIRASISDDATREAQRTAIDGLHRDVNTSETLREKDNAYLRAKVEDYQALAAIAPALMKMAQTSEEFQRRQYETKVTNDRDLYVLTMNSVKALRDFSAKYARLQGALEVERQQHWGAQATPDQQRRIFEEEMVKSQQLSANEQAEFQTSILPGAIYARNALLARKLQEPPLDPEEKSEMTWVLNGSLAGLHPELQLANYLEFWARPIAPKAR